MRQGADDEVLNGSMYLALSGRRQILDRAKDRQRETAKAERDAAKALDERQDDLDHASKDHDEALAAADEAGTTADQAIADTGARDLPAVAYIAYRDAAAAADQAHSECRLSAAVLAGIGRIGSGHGRSQGASIDHLGRVQPELRGVRGAKAPDTDEGTVDGDDTADVAVGPMQVSTATLDRVRDRR